VANPVSVPFQDNFKFGVGPDDVTLWMFNVQTAIPISLNKIARQAHK